MQFAVYVKIIFIVTMWFCFSVSSASVTFNYKDCVHMMCVHNNHCAICVLVSRESIFRFITSIQVTLTLKNQGICMLDVSRNESKVITLDYFAHPVRDNLLRETLIVLHKYTAQDYGTSITNGYEQTKEEYCICHSSTFHSSANQVFDVMTK